MHVTVFRLTLHDNVFYATREIGRLYETGRYLHNYGLAFALGLVSAPYYSPVATPNYVTDLSPLNALEVYVTPARPLEVRFELNTFKYADNRYRVKMEPGSRNSPSFGRAKELTVGSAFEFAVVSDQQRTMPKWMRLGKWMSKTAIEVALAEEVGKVIEGEYSSAFPVNPMDLAPASRLISYDLISMPPVSLLDNARLAGAHYRLADGRCIPAGLAYRFPGG